MKRITVMILSTLLLGCFILGGCGLFAERESDSINLSALYSVSPNESVIEVTNDATPYLKIASTESDVCYGYYNKNYFVGSNIFVAYKRSENALLAADLTEKVVYNLGISCKDHSAYLVHDEKIYYLGTDQHTLNVFDIRTGVNEVVYVFEHLIGGFIETTLDGRYISLTTYESPDADGKYRATLFDMQTREIIDIFDYIFEYGSPIANHHMFNPVDHTQLFFAHDQDVSSNLDRMWLYEIGKEPYCIVEQKFTVKADGSIDIQDKLTHECWSYDGKGLWYVDYASAICYIDLTSSDRSVKEIFTSYPYWHTSCSPDGKYVAGDVAGGVSKVILINLETGEENEVLSMVPYKSGGLDPHPGFSRNSEMLMFECLSGDGEKYWCSVGVVKIADVEWVLK